MATKDSTLCGFSESDYERLAAAFARHAKPPAGLFIDSSDGLEAATREFLASEFSPRKFAWMAARAWERWSKVSVGAGFVRVQLDEPSPAGSRAQSVLGAPCDLAALSTQTVYLQISLSTFELIAAAANPQATLDGLRYAGLVVTLLYPSRESVLTVSDCS